jgi:hypothetical protein
MRTIATGIALLALTVLPGLPSGTAHASTVTCCGRSRHVHWTERLDPGDARVAITTQDGDVTMVLTDDDVAIQLSNRTMHRVHRELRDAEDDQDNWFGSAIVTAVTGTVLAVLDHSLVCHVRDLRDVSYVDGRLVFTARDGRSVFGDIDICDTDVTSAFSPRDAESFVREFKRLKAGR